jgi:hypothetical protein
MKTLPPVAADARRRTPCWLCLSTGQSRYNEVTSLDAAMTLSLHFGAHSRRANEFDR